MLNESAGGGKNYTNATVTISGGGGSGAVARAVLGPPNGIGADPRDEGGITPTTDAIEQRKADAAAEKKRAVDAINKKYEESGEKSDIPEEFTWGG